jgi:hypothetical protein
MPYAMAEQMEQDVEDLRLELDLDASAAQLATPRIQCESLKKVDEVVHPSALSTGSGFQCAREARESRDFRP